MKKNLLSTLIFSGVIVLIIGIYLGRSDILPSRSEEFSNSIQNKQMRVKQPSNDNTQTIQENEKMTNEECEFFVISSVVSKKLNYLNKIDVKDYVTSDVSVDSENRFLDDHLYLQVELAIKNVKASSQTIMLSNIRLLTKKNNELLNLTDIPLTNTVSSAGQKDSFQLILNANEEKRIYIGYIIKENRYQEIKNQLYILPDLSGISAMDPQLLTKIELDVMEDQL